jgi:hypothetical protein
MVQAPLRSAYPPRVPVRRLRRSDRGRKRPSPFAGSPPCDLEGPYRRRMQKGLDIAPRQRGTAAVKFFPDNPSAGLVHRGVTASPELSQQSRLAAAGASRNHDEPIRRLQFSTSTFKPRCSGNSCDAAPLVKAGTGLSFWLQYSASRWMRPVRINPPARDRIERLRLHRAGQHAHRAPGPSTGKSAARPACR